MKQNVSSMARIQAAADELHARADGLRVMALATKEWEDAVDTEAEGDRKSVGAKLGAMLKKKGLKAADLVSQWGGRDGLVDEKEFRDHVYELGIQESESDINALFKRLDSDGSGSMDKAEVIDALRALADESAQQLADLNAVKNRTKELFAAAKAAQEAEKKRKAQEMREMAEAAQQAERDAELRASAAVAEKKAKAAAAAEKKAKAAAEKAAFEAKIDAKRRDQDG